jgi:hypothetical protein
VRRAHERSVAQRRPATIKSSINTATGQGTFVSDYGGHGLQEAYGTSFVTEAIAVPAPSSLVLFSLGLIGIAGIVAISPKSAVTIARYPMLVGSAPTVLW